MKRSVLRSCGDAVRRWRWLGVAMAGAAASLSFAQAAAAVGLPIPWFAQLGPSFFAWQPAHQVLEEKLMLPASPPPDPARLRDVERRILASQPLSSAALRLTAWSDVRRGREAEALGRIRMIDRITRRDAVAQLWLLEEAVRRDDVAGVLRRYDVLLRTQTDLRGLLLEKLSVRLENDQIRLGLAHYADARSPWFPDLLDVAARKGHADGAAALLLALPVLPDATAYRSAYAAVVAALVKERAFDALGKLYRRLPGAGSPADPGLTAAGLSQGYAPFRWAMAATPEREARLIADPSNHPVLAVRSAPFTRGEVASRVVLLPPHPVALSWISDAGGRATGGRAQWVIRCEDDGRLAISGDLLGGGTRGGIQPIPYPCSAALIALVVDGGLDERGTAGEATTSFQLSHLRLLPAAPRGGAAAPAATTSGLAR